MKKVAFISDGWKRFFIYAWVDGIINRIRDYSEEVCLHHYNCHGNWSSDELHNQGEYNIFNLPDLEQYDGIILDCNNITDKNQLNYIIEHVRKSKVPTVSIARDIEGFYYAGIDNAQPINNLMEHMYNVHNCRSFVFAGGPIDNYENDCRIAAYKDFLEEKSLDVEDNPVFYGDYDFKNGVEFFKKYVEEGRKIPDVVICACDNIAAGVCAQAEEMGYRVPDDFKVTGFDNLDKAAYFRPQITTVDHHNRGKTSRMCMNILIDIWEGRNPKKYNFSETTCIFGESCGCANSGLVDYREHIRGQIIYGIHKDLEDERINELEGNMAKCGKFVELYECMNRFLIELGCDGFFVVVDEALVTGKNKNNFPTKGYHKDSLNVVYAYDNGKKHKFESIEELNVYLEESGVKNDYLFTPIHFRQYAVGYSIIKNAKFLYDNPYLYDLHNILVKNIEAMYTQMKIELANKKLKEIYNRDQLTGIYNRVAYAEIITPMFKRCYEENIVCAIGFVDVDKFKQINDTYGHDYGDEVLKKVANILQKKCPKYGYVCRYGGDEFIVFFPHANKESAERVKHSISEAAQDIGVKLSIGMILSSEDHGSNIDDYFEFADKCMYEEKMRHKNEE